MVINADSFNKTEDGKHRLAKESLADDNDYAICFGAKTGDLAKVA